MQARNVLKRMLGAAPYQGREEQAYRRLSGRGFAPDAMIDVGAYQGEWTRAACRVFGNVPVLMVEAQGSKVPFLDRVIADLPNASYVSAVLGSEAGKTVTFYEMETGSSYFPEHSNAARTEINLTTSRLDDVAHELRSECLFLKIDVQGAELEVLRGGAETLARAQLVQLEVAISSYNEGAPTMLEVLSFMDERGFIPVDISSETRINDCLVQIDILFAKKDSGLRAEFFTFQLPDTRFRGYIRRR